MGKERPAADARAEAAQIKHAPDKKETSPEKDTSSKKPSRFELLKRSDLIPRNKTEGYSRKFVAERRKWVAEKTGAELHHIGEYSINPEELKSRIENMIGMVQVPLGIAGPIKVNGEHADGLFYVPFATTEGTLVETYQRGMLAVTMAGGANVRVIKDSFSYSPGFILKNISETTKFINWVKDHFNQIKFIAESTTTHGKLLEIVPHTIGRRVILDFRYYTGDAMGSNMAIIATTKACNYIMECTEVEHYYLASNFSSEKKASFYNLITGYGKEVQVEATLTRDNMLRYLGAEPEAIYDYWLMAFLTGSLAGMAGINGHFANAIASIFTACGQDIAQTVNASCGINICEIMPNGDLYMSLKLSEIIVGTVGGGTMTDTAKECLQILDCVGQGKVIKFAEIIGATLLAGEIAIMAAITNGTFAQAHLNRRNAALVAVK